MGYDWPMRSKRSPFSMNLDDAVAPNNADADRYGEIRAVRDGGFWDVEGGIAHLRGIRDRLGEIASDLGHVVMHPIDTIEGIRNPVVRERLTPYGSDIDHFIIEMKIKLRSPHGRGQIMGDVITLRLGKVLAALRAGTAAAVKLTGLSAAEARMVRKALEKLKKAGYDVRPIGEVIRADLPKGTAGLTVGTDGVVLGDLAFVSERELLRTIEEELLHLNQKAGGLIQSAGPGTAQALENAVDAQRKF